MDYFSRKSLSKYLMNTIDFNEHDVDIFINGTWLKYAGNIGSPFSVAAESMQKMGRQTSPFKIF
jgi:hypothetical protein